MAQTFSKTQIDKLGERLKRDNIDEDDLRLLSRYRASFTKPFEFVVGLIREKLVLEPTGRPVKSTASITQKLRRESIRLSQIQDIAGCRIIVSGIAEQQDAPNLLCEVFEETIVSDRRAKPSNGYRAIHVIVRLGEKQVEIQVRTQLQHLWAELSERLSDFDPAIKYGGGNQDDQKLLSSLATSIQKLETIETSLAGLERETLKEKSDIAKFEQARELDSIDQKALDELKQNNIVMTRDINELGKNYGLKRQAMSHSLYQVIAAVRTRSRK